MLQDFTTDHKLPEFLSTEFKNDGWYMVIGKLKGLLESNIEEIIETNKPQTLIISGKVYIGKNVKIGENVVIHGPAYIGDNAEIAPFAYIRPGSYIGKNCVIGSFSTIKNSVMMDGSKTGDYVYVGDSIVFERARFGSHCSTLNRKFDQSNIDFIYQDKKLETGLDKLGLIIGEDSRLGGGVKTLPGSMIGRSTFVGAGAVIDGYIDSNKFVKVKIETEIKENKIDGKLNDKSTHY